MPDHSANARLQFEALDALSGRSPRKLFSLSPNDVLVQISLPLVLILAIATRLMTIGQGLAALEKGPVILELWKQQLILRIDRAADAWENAAGIQAFPDFQRVFWRNGRPDDPAFQTLCAKSQELADLEAMSLGLYRAALSYRPETAPGAQDAAGAGFFPMYDPALDVDTPAAAGVPAEFRIDDARRAFAMQYIHERCRKWKAQVEMLQWSALDRLAAEMPPNDPLMDSRPDAQMAKVAAEMRRLGYPLLPGIVAEYHHPAPGADRQPGG